MIGFAGLCLLASSYVLQRFRWVLPAPLPSFPTQEPYTPWPTMGLARSFNFPLLPGSAYGPYTQGITGPLAVDTRYGVQNPSMGNYANCFRTSDQGAVPFSQLYHAGVDLFALDGSGQVVWGKAAHEPVHAVADGVTVFVQDAGGDGYIVITEHFLTEGSVYSVYWHVDHVQVRTGQPVVMGQVIAVVADRGLNSHLHWEMRSFYDGRDLFPVGTAGARGTCNGRVAGVGYTWDDDLAWALPDAYGYFDPQAFVADWQH